MNDKRQYFPSGVPGRDAFIEEPPPQRTREEQAESVEGVTSPSEARETIDTDALARMLMGKSVKDIDGAPIGTVEHVYYREQRAVPEWVGVSTGLITKTLRYAPLEGASTDDDGDIILAYPKGMVDDSPEAEASPPVADRELALYRHYNMRRVTPGSGVELAVDEDPLRAWGE
jgi:hypothetical protein